MKEGFIYIWYDRKHKRYYLGCHWGTLDDGYICSSSWMNQGYKHRPEDFKRRIIQRNISRNDLLSEEHKWLSQIKNEELGKKYYNLSKRYFGHWIGDDEQRLTVKQKLSESSKKLHQDPEYRKKFLEGRKKLPPQTKETIEKRAKSNRGKKRTEEARQNISKSLTGRIKGPLSDEHKKNVSESLKGKNNPFFGKQHDPELKKRMNEKTSQTMKGRPPNNAGMIKGTFWWNNGTINKRSKESPGIDWIKGKLKVGNLQIF